MNMEKNSAQLQATIVQYMPYLIEIRKRLFFVVSVFIIATVVGFYNFEPIIQFILNFYRIKGIDIVFTSPFQYLSLAISAGVTIGLIASLPLIVFQLVSFLRPALKKHEYRSVVYAIPISIVLFGIGFSFGVWVMKFVIEVFSKQMAQFNMNSLWDIETFMANIFMTSLWLGIVFQFPVIITPLIRLKVIKYRSLVKLRGMIYFGLLLFTMSLPPVDILTDCLVFFPLALLFEITLLINRRFAKVTKEKKS